MRPPDLPGGNRADAGAQFIRGPLGFNEAAGFTRRKLTCRLPPWARS